MSTNEQISELVQELRNFTQSIQGSQLTIDGLLDAFKGAIEGTIFNESVISQFAGIFADKIDAESDNNQQKMTNVTSSGILDRVLESSVAIGDKLDTLNDTFSDYTTSLKSMSKDTIAALKIGGSAATGAAGGGGLAKGLGLLGGGGFAKLAMNPMALGGMALAGGGIYGMSKASGRKESWWGNIKSSWDTQGAEGLGQRLAMMTGFKKDEALMGRPGMFQGHRGLVERAIGSIASYFGFKPDTITTLFTEIYKTIDGWISTAMKGLGTMLGVVMQPIIDALDFIGIDVKAMLKIAERPRIERLDSFDPTRKSILNELNRQISTTGDSTGVLAEHKAFFDKLGPDATDQDIARQEDRIQKWYNMGAGLKYDVKRLADDADEMDMIRQFGIQHEGPAKVFEDTQNFWKNGKWNLDAQERADLWFSSLPPEEAAEAGRMLMEIRQAYEQKPVAGRGNFQMEKSIDDGIVLQDGTVIPISSKDNIIAVKQGGVIDKLLGGIDNAAVVAAVDELRQAIMITHEELMESQILVAQAAASSGGSVVDASSVVVDNSTNTNDTYTLDRMIDSFYG